MKASWLFANMEHMGWQVGMWSDLALAEDGVRQYTTQPQKWAFVNQGTVGIVLGEEWARTWRESGAISRSGSARPNGPVRALAIDIKTKDKRGGITFVACYAPTNRPETMVERTCFFELIQGMVRRSPCRGSVVCGGDMNSVAYKGGEGEFLHWTGPEAKADIAAGSEDFMECCREEGLAVCGSWFRQRHIQRHGIILGTEPAG